MLSYRGHGLGEITVGIGFGPVIVLGAYYIQAQRLSYLPLIASIPIGILILLVLLINEFPDQEADKKTGKHTLTVVLGKKSAAGLYVVLLLFVYLTTLLFVIAHILPKLSLICFFTVPLAVKAAKIILANWNVTNKLIPASSATIALHLFFGLLLTLSFVLH
jgi:1,4-dihydroxy-2-naphthoate octaprenyltransferase